jgi:demethylmenaquinone methyltransferase/2-methoxy-6-polyprenyl-1,4-benzoquinol methylase
LETPDLFNEIAAHYDTWSNLLSGEGIRVWHRFAVHQMQLTPGMKVLDVGCGTGTTTQLMAKAIGTEGEVVGLDPASEMLSVAKNAVQDAHSAPITWVLGQGEHLPFGDGMFDRVTAQFSLRNMNYWIQGLHEMARVLKDGGQLTVLEMVQPTTTLGAFAWRSLDAVTSNAKNIGLVPYQWLGDSLRHAPTAEELRDEIRQLGFHEILTHHWLGDLVVVLTAIHDPAAVVAPRRPRTSAVVWAVDGSATSLHAAPWINEFIPPGVAVHMVTVIPRTSHGEQVRETDRAACRRHQRTAESLLTEGKFRIESHIQEGTPGEVLRELARQTESDLIIVGNKHRKGLSDHLLGGATRDLLAHSHLPVLIIPTDMDR